jgi:hypothetical protein
MVNGNAREGYFPFAGISNGKILGENVAADQFQMKVWHKLTVHSATKLKQRT